MTGFSLITPEQVARDLASKTKELRLQRGWKQATLSKRSGVSLASLRRFERTGLVSLQSFLKLAFTLNRLDEFASLLDPPPARSLRELEELESVRIRHTRKRGST